MRPRSTSVDAGIVRRLARPPPAALFMAGAFVPKRAWPCPPSIRLELAPAATDPGALAQYFRLTGQRAGDTLPLAWPQVWAFRLQMALLTDRRFPLPIWSALQVRNRLRRLAAMPRDAAYGISVAVERCRDLDKGTEVDLRCELRDTRGALAWDSLTTFYWRGRRLGPRAPASSAPAASPAVDNGGVYASWNSGAGGGWRFGALTGDYNGLHWSDRYARAFGFARAFHHPPRIAGACLARLESREIEPAVARQQLDLWIKGPVFYRSELTLRVAPPMPTVRLFALHVDGEQRPALIGRWCEGWTDGEGTVGAGTSLEPSASR